MSQPRRPPRYARRCLAWVLLAAVAASWGVACGGGAAAAGTDEGVDAESGDRPLALVYRGPGACDGCEEALAQLLRQAGLRTRYVGPAALRSDATFVGAALWAQPGGDDTMAIRDAVGAAAWPAAAERLRRFVRGGGVYLGVCLGGYLAGEWLDDDGTVPALRLLAGDASAYTHTPVDAEQDQVLEVQWLVPAQARWMYFQEGPYFTGDGVPYARYADGRIAALQAKYGEGVVAVSGVHFEAERGWYDEHDLEDPDGLDADLGVRFVRDALR